ASVVTTSAAARATTSAVLSAVVAGAMETSSVPTAATPSPELSPRVETPARCHRSTTGPITVAATWATTTTNSGKATVVGSIANSAAAGSTGCPGRGFSWTTAWPARLISTEMYAAITVSTAPARRACGTPTQITAPSAWAMSSTPAPRPATQTAEPHACGVGCTMSKLTTKTAASRASSSTADPTAIADPATTGCSRLGSNAPRT